MNIASAVGFAVAWLSALYVFVWLADDNEGIAVLSAILSASALVFALEMLS